MEEKLPEKMIVRLIADDLKHKQLTGGLNKLGFPGDDPDLSISESVFELLGLNTDDPRLSYLENAYYERTEMVHDYSRANITVFRSLAEDVYRWLLRERNKHLTPTTEQ